MAPTGPHSPHTQGKRHPHALEGDRQQRAGPGRDLVVAHHPERTVVMLAAHLLGEEECHHPAADQLESLAGEVGDRPLWLACAAVAKLTSQDLAQFVRLHNQAQAKGGQFVLCNLQPLPRQVLRATRLDELLTIHAEAPALPVPPQPKRGRRSRVEAASVASPDLGQPAVLLWDPHVSRAEQVCAALRRTLNVLQAASLEQLLDASRACPPLAVVLALPDPVGTASAAQAWAAIQTLASSLVVVLYGDEQQVTVDVSCRGMLVGARKVVPAAPASLAAEVEQAVRGLLEKERASGVDQARLLALFDSLGFRGRSAAVQEVFRQADQVAAVSELPVLLLGETGTGKEQFARAIHALDPQRCQGPFRPYNCSAVHGNLAESELFGHVKGAFSGADQERKGLFRSADGGTLLLDEIGDLDPALQPKLLRVLQERRVRPVGADHEVDIDVRIIAATDQPLEQRVEAGQFRRDLWHRLSAFIIRLPPLRERPEDIDILAQHFLQLHQTRDDRGLVGFGPGVLEGLRRLPWEGNARELENLVQEILAQQPSGPRVEVGDLPRRVIEKVASGSCSPAAAGPLEAAARWMCQQQWPIDKAVAEFERCLVQAVLVQTAGNRTQAAKVLHLSRQGLANKIKKYHLEQAGADKQEERRRM